MKDEKLSIFFMGLTFGCFICVILFGISLANKPKPTPPPCTKIILQGSNDGKTWITIDSLTLKQ